MKYVKYEPKPHVRAALYSAIRQYGMKIKEYNRNRKDDLPGAMTWDAVDAIIVEIQKEIEVLEEDK